VLPSGRTLAGSAHQTFADALSRSDDLLSMDCGARGTCGQCRIRFLSKAPQPGEAERRLISTTDLALGWRLACQQPIVAGATIEVTPSKGRPRTKATSPLKSRVQYLRPGISPFRVTLRPTDTWNPQSIDRALARDMGERLDCSVSALRALSDLPRNRALDIEGVRRDSQILDLREAANAIRVLGVAIDVGTTTLAIYLHDLTTGKLLASEADYNPQRNLGADVISRIGFIRSHGSDGLSQLQSSVLDELNALIQAACQRCCASMRDIYRIVVVGNPTMLHLLAGVSPVGIDQSPFESVFLNAVMPAPSTLGLQAHPEANLRLLPSASSYIGADTVSGVLATSLGDRKRTELLVDIGTNGEIVLAHNGRLIACSAAAGPAFEGAAIRDGMNAVTGAIHDVTLAGDKLHCVTIDDAPAKGICGTGLIGAVHELVLAGLIQPSGRLTPSPVWAERFRGEGKDLRVALVDEPTNVALYQEDIRAFQLGKAAMRAGIDTLLHSASVSPADLDRVYVAGAFGTHLKAERALGTGLLPAIPADRFHAVGNTAGQGAAMVLLDEHLQSEIDALAKRIENIELAALPEFSRRYLDQMAFPLSG